MCSISGSTHCAHRMVPLWVMLRVLLWHIGLRFTHVYSHHGAFCSTAAVLSSGKHGMVGSSGNKAWSSISWILASACSFITGACKLFSRKLRSRRSVLQAARAQSQKGKTGFFASLQEHTGTKRSKCPFAFENTTCDAEIYARKKAPNRSEWNSTAEMGDCLITKPGHLSFASWIMECFLLCPNCRSQNWLCTKNRLH